MTSYIGLIATMSNEKVSKCQTEIAGVLDKAKIRKKYDCATIKSALENLQTLLDLEEAKK